MWVELTAFDVNVDQLRALEESIVAILESGAAALELFAIALGIIRLLLLLALNALDALVGALVATIINTVLDFLQNNVGVCVHVNLNWNPNWRYKKRPGEALNASIVDFVEDSQLPWAGNGTTGWLIDLAASANDPSDPFRPLTDADTKVNGIIFLKGIADGGELADLKVLFDAFTDWEHIKEFLEIGDKLGTMNEARQKLDRFGPLMASDFMAALMSGPLNGRPPYWVSIPVAVLLPPLGELFALLKKIADNLRADLSSLRAIDKLIAILQRRAQMLAEAAEKLKGIVDTIESIIEFFLTTHAYYGSPTEGGFGAFIQGALAAEGLPFFGTQGIVAGVCLMSAQDDPSNHFESLFEMIGLQLADISSEVTTRTEELEDGWGDIFP